MDINSLSLEQRVGQFFFIGIPGPDLDAPTRELLDAVQPGGVCLFARNIRSREQTRKLLDELRDHLTVPPFLSVDEEGGLVDRLRRIMHPLPAAASIRTRDEAARLGGIVGETLSILGFNMDFAPVIDVVDEERSAYSSGLFTRPFGRSRQEVVELAGGFLRSLQMNGILGCLKHFPGLGAATVDSHEELPIVDIDNDEFTKVDLYPYRELLANVQAVMIAHAAYRNVSLQERDQNGTLLPSSLSKGFTTTLLREQLGFSGLAITDDLEMGAIVKNHGIGDACKMALKAGADMLAICAEPGRMVEGYRAVLAGARRGEIREEQLFGSVERIMAIKAGLPTPRPFDEAALDHISNETAELVVSFG